MGFRERFFKSKTNPIPPAQNATPRRPNTKPIPSQQRPPPEIFPPADSPNPYHRLSGSELAPYRVKCHFALIYAGKEYKDLEDRYIIWQNPLQYTAFNDAADRCIREHGVPESTQLYRKSGVCRLVNDANGQEFESRILESEEQWVEVLPLLVMSFCSRHPYVAFHLEIRWEYSDLSINKVKGQRYAVTVQTVVRSKMKQNWDRKKFLPRKDLDQIFSESTIKELIHEDKSLNGLTPSGKQNLLDNIIADASRLLGVCICVDMPLACLYHMMDAGFKDTSLPLTDPRCAKEEYINKFEDLQLWQGSFIAHEFHDDHGMPKHRQLKDEVVVPLFFDKDNDRIGEGGFGEVYKVKIDADHHSFSSEKGRFFALKIFKELGSRTADDFENESKTLNKLWENPHPHITTHLASWTQAGRFYMLFPCAEMHLGAFLRSWPSPEPDNAFVSWLVLQMKGLADGLRRIHNSGPLGLGPDSVARNLQLPEKPRRTGYHHDLKPQNILAFLNENVGTRQPRITDFTFRISDFGTARLNDVRSHTGIGAGKPSYKTSNLSHGATIYGAPDWALEGATSRPFDVWSLGCVFLETLLWALRVSGSNLDQFETDRLHSPRDQSNQTSAFWHQDGGGHIFLKSAVIERLRQLRDYCRGRGVFEQLVRSTTDMLTIPPLKRPTSVTIYNDLDTQFIQAQVDFRTPDFYKRDERRQHGVAAPPTNYSSNSRSPSPSIDERAYAPNSRYLSAHTAHQRRPSSSRGGQGIVRNENTEWKEDSSPVAGHLSPITTRDLPLAGKHERSPSQVSVTISDHDAAYTSKAVKTVTNGEHAIQSTQLIGLRRVDFGPEDFTSPFRHRSASTASRRTQSSDF